jgi:CRP/FNR family transcriptional regulator
MRLAETSPAAVESGFFMPGGGDASGDHLALWDDLLGGATVCNVPAGGTIRRVGDEPSLAAILSGTVRVFTWTPAGRQATIRYARAGDLVGVAALLRGSDMWGAEAVTEASVALVAADRLRSLPTRHPEFGWAMAEELARIATESLCTSVGEGGQLMTVRVARHLVASAVEGTDGQMLVPITHQQAADAVGTAREVATRVLRQLRLQGLIETGRGCIVLMDVKGLQDLASR